MVISLQYVILSWVSAIHLARVKAYSCLQLLKSKVHIKKKEINFKFQLILYSFHLITCFNWPTVLKCLNGFSAHESDRLIEFSGMQNNAVLQHPHTALLMNLRSDL